MFFDFQNDFLVHTCGGNLTIGSNLQQHLSTSSVLELESGDLKTSLHEIHSNTQRDK